MILSFFYLIFINSFQLLHARIKISDISVDISAIYRISGVNETIFDTENRLQEKSEYIGDISVKYRNLTEISVEMSTLERRACGKKFWFFWEIYRRYIENIDDISAIFSIYRLKYRRAAWVAQICCAENRTIQINPPFQTASLTDLMARFESGLIQRPRFHSDLKYDSTVKFLIQRPEIKSKLDPTTKD